MSSCGHIREGSQSRINSSAHMCFLHGKYTGRCCQQRIFNSRLESEGGSLLENLETIRKTGCGSDGDNSLKKSSIFLQLEVTKAIGYNSMAWDVNWSAWEQPYIFPLMNLLGGVLRRIQDQKVREIILIGP